LKHSGIGMVVFPGKACREDWHRRVVITKRRDRCVNRKQESGAKLTAVLCVCVQSELLGE